MYISYSITIGCCPVDKLRLHFSPKVSFDSVEVVRIYARFRESPRKSVNRSVGGTQKNNRSQRRNFPNTIGLMHYAM